MDDAQKDKLKQDNPDLYRIAFQKGTEAPFSGRVFKDDGAGVYKCAVCGVGLFKGDSKFDSGSGWPSFFEPISETSVKTQIDDSLGMNRTEVKCANCDAHLGHVFDDGPQPTGKRYCINSISLDKDSKE